MTNFYSANGINFTNPRDKTAINVTYNGILAKLIFYVKKVKFVDRNHKI